jgi:hypothetical protein
MVRSDRFPKICERTQGSETLTLRSAISALSPLESGLDSHCYCESFWHERAWLHRRAWSARPIGPGGWLFALSGQRQFHIQVGFFYVLPRLLLFFPDNLALLSCSS